ncbi:hypothetical protein TIFTF001_022721 [Ficus carica]|uniref:Uncharacterized protein n=1 Tax=Ficus carica TaxID=3494 RepID=A0AA88AZN6_FICCA|nr:hypothetical protein TIFTF001_022721 [Ficus carica]
MEPAKIDWKNLEWRFVEDELYEHINAPKWFDFLSPLDHPVDDESWFCRPDCNHPKSVQDFLKSTPPKLASPAGVSEISPFGQRNQTEAKVKRRGLLNSINTKFNENRENQNPNLSTPPYKHQGKILKMSIKSSAEKKEAADEAMLPPPPPPPPRLKSTLSARNLFAGRDILNQITEFCSELKRMAMRAKERETEESAKENVVVVLKEKDKEESKGDVLSELDLKGKEKPFQEIEGSILKEKPRRKK